MFSKDEYKYFLKFLDSRDDCNVVTMGKWRRKIMMHNCADSH